MRVIVGKPTEQTPMMAGLMRYTVVNPYWNVPPDLVRTRVAPKVLDGGVSYFRSMRYEALSGWSSDARVLDPQQLDWAGIAAGRQELRVRQLPGGENMMGRMKFMFPNDLGIYLHDTPAKELFKEADRRFSSGCIRVEDAPRLARWLFGKVPTARSGKPEQHVDLPDPVPVYITYLTAVPGAGGIVFRDDVYGRDRVKGKRG
jgi:L,D-transpeptidase YcbB